MCLYEFDSAAHKDRYEDDDRGHRTRSALMFVCVCVTTTTTTQCETSGDNSSAARTALRAAARAAQPSQMLRERNAAATPPALAPPQRGWVCENFSPTYVAPMGPMRQPAASGCAKLVNIRASGHEKHDELAAARQRTMATSAFRVRVIAGLRVAAGHPMGPAALHGPGDELDDIEQMRGPANATIVPHYGQVCLCVSHTHTALFSATANHIGSLSTPTLCPNSHTHNATSV